MQLGFVSAILPDQSLEEVFSIAADIGYECIEVMCWPQGKATRRYAGVTHIDVAKLSKTDIEQISHLQKIYGVHISGLGYYPNPLVSNAKERSVYVSHIKKVIKASAMLKIGRMNTFIGRDHNKSIDDNWPIFMKVWPGIIKYAEKNKVKVGIENCPMIFTDDEWPGGKNLGSSPDIWERMYKAIPSRFFGLNYDPSHMIWQQMDYLTPMRDFSKKLFHIHAKDVRIDKHLLDKKGIMAPPNEWHTPKLPGLGEVDWGKFFSVLSSTGYDGPVCVEVEDRAYEGTKKKRIAALKQSYTYLKQFIT